MKTGNMHDNIQQIRKILITDQETEKNASESVKYFFLHFFSRCSQDTMQKTCFGEINCMILN